MKLVVCGCSWSSECNLYPNTGYGTYLAGLINASEYINLARPSASNFAIRLQIDYALRRLSPDFIVVCWTSAERVEWTIPNTEETYNSNLGLECLSYNDSPVWNQHPHANHQDIINCESISSLFSEKHPYNLNQISKEQYNALKHYQLYLFNRQLEEHKQYFMIESAVHQLTTANVPFIMVPGWLSHIETDIMHNWPIIPKRNLITHMPAQIFRQRKDENPQYGIGFTHHLWPEDHQMYATKYLLPVANDLLSKTSNN